MYTHVHICTHHVIAWGGQRLGLLCPPFSLLYFVVWDSVSRQTQSSLILQHYLASEPLSSTSHHPPTAGIMGVHHRIWLLCGCWRFELRSSYLCSKHFNQWATSPAVPVWLCNHCFEESTEEHHEALAVSVGAVTFLFSLCPPQHLPSIFLLVFMSYIWPILYRTLWWRFRVSAKDDRHEMKSLPSFLICVQWWLRSLAATLWT